MKAPPIPIIAAIKPTNKPMIIGVNALSYNPDLLNSYDIIDKHQLSIGDVIVIYYLFDKVLFAELINEEN